MWDPFAEFETAVLPNGLSVHVAHWMKRPWVTAGFLIHSGAKQDPAGKEGIAHFVEHLVSSNTPIPYRKIHDFFEDMGGAVTLGHTGLQRTRYSFFSSCEKLQQAFSLFSTMLLTGRLENFVENQRQVILSEYGRKYPMKVWADLYQRELDSLYTNWWNRRWTSSLGTPDSIRAITKEDLQEFYDEHYTPANLSIVCVGGINLKEVVKILQSTGFGISKPGRRTPLLSPLSDFPPPAETKYLFEVSKHLQSEVPRCTGKYESAAVLPGTIRETTLTLLHRMMHRVLFDEVREKRSWSYSPFAGKSTYQDTHLVSLTCEGLPVSSLGQIEEVVEGCLDSIPTAESLFNQVKHKLLVSTLMLDIPATRLREMAIDDLAKEHRIVSFAEYREEIEGTSFDEVLSVMKWLRPERRYTVLTVP